MDTGVDHGRQPEGAGDVPPDVEIQPDVDVQPDVEVQPLYSVAPDVAGSVGQPPMPVYAEVPTTILDLRAVFAEAGPHDAPPLGVVTVEREQPVRAALAFVAVLAVIAAVAGGAVIGVASVGKALFARASGPQECSAAQVVDGAILENWLLSATRRAVGSAATVVRAGCVTEGLVAPAEAEAVSTTVAAGKPTARVIAALKSRDCTLGTASPSGVRTCTVTIATRLAALELRPAKNGKTTTFTVTFR